jgi:hypothetical protein
MIKSRALLFSAFCLFLVPSMGTGQVAAPGAEQSEAHHDVFEEIRDGFQSRINMVGFGIIQQPLSTAVNPDNVLEIPRYQTELDLRPDFYWNFRRLELGFKPRLVFSWRKWDQGPRRGSEGDVEPFVNEWLVQYRIADPLFVSYGRQNLQWGPSYLLSPSNPFNVENGRSNPQLEVPGLDYGIIRIPGAVWSASLIANTDNGRADVVGTFKRAYALKLDYLGTEKYFSLIPSYREDGTSRVGFFGTWNVSDASILYAEGEVADKRRNPKMLIGASYTLQMGPTVGLEYFRNQNGCNKEPVTLCAATGVSGAAFKDVVIQDGERFLRRNYLSLQYVHTRIADVFSTTVRWVRNLDDDSNRFLGIFEYELGDHAQLFMINNVLEGTRKTEFRSVVGYSVMTGVSYTF